LAKQSGTVYICLVGHTSGTFATDLAAGKWSIYQGVSSTDLSGNTGASLVSWLAESVKKTVGAWIDDILVRLGKRVEQIDTYAAVATFTGVAGRTVYVAGRTAVGDGAGGLFTVSVGTSPGANGGTIINTANGWLTRSYAGAAVNPKWFGAVGDGVTDDTAAFTAAVAAGQTVEIPDNFVIKMTASFTLPQGKSIVGVNRYRSQMYFAGDINGLVVGIQSVVRNLRIKGDGSATSTRALLDMADANCYRSVFDSLIIGGQGTSIGDAANVRYPGMAISSGNCFLIALTNTYVFNAYYGWDNYHSSVGRLNGVQVANVEFHSCQIGSRLKILNAVTFDACTWENSNEEGAIFSSCRGVTMNSPYFESNNQDNTGLYKSDFTVNADGLNGAASDVGGTLHVNNAYFSKGASSYSVAAANITNQRLCYWQGGFIVSYSTTNSLVINSQGLVENFFINTTAPTSFAETMTVGEFLQSGVTQAGITARRFRTLSGTTGALAAAGTSVLFTGTAGRVYLLEVMINTNASTARWVGIVQCHASSALTATAIDSAGVTITNSSGSPLLTNTSGATATFDWSATRLR
jgi:hypothetical protein